MCLDKQIRHRACTLRDTAYALIKAEMDTDFEEQCQEISRTRKAREGKVVPISTASTSGPEPQATSDITTPLDGEAKVSIDFIAQGRRFLRKYFLSSISMEGLPSLRLSQLLINVNQHQVGLEASLNRRLKSARPVMQQTSTMAV